MRALLTTSIAIAALVLSNVPSVAELKDFQIARLILTGSECILEGQLVRTEMPDGSWSYHGRCSNETFYPDGIDVTCPDPDNNDERSCTILTRRKAFRNLDMLRQFGSN